MIVGVKLDPTSYNRIKEFVDKGTYESVESFIEISVLNQILLESNGVTSIGESRQSKFPKTVADTKSHQARQQTNVLQVIQHLTCPENAQLQFSPPLPLTEETKSFPIWGQINRFAPAKMVLRMLANQILALGTDRIDLKRFSADVAETMTSARTFIEKKDRKDRIRGTELYVALAKKDPRSQQRFINFYIGRLPSGKWTDGILTGLGLARIEQTEDGSVVIGLTEAGSEFACLPSPLIDEFIVQEKQIEGSFSSAEVEFLLDHLQSTRPGEYEFMATVVQRIKDGVATPTALRQKMGAFLREKYPQIKISEKFVNTMLVGVMGRLVEMRAVGIEKDAQRSKYSLTDVGESILNRMVKA